MAIENVDGPLFAYFKPPIANTADSNSMCGMSIYGDAATVELIKQADEQWERLRWEYKSSERKVLMDGTSSTADMFNKRLFEIGPFSPDGDFSSTSSRRLGMMRFIAGFRILFGVLNLILAFLMEIFPTRKRLKNRD